MDNKDQRILDFLQHDGKLSNAEIGDRIGLSTTAVVERIKKLKKEGIIRENVYLLDPPSLGLEVCAFIQVLMPVPTQEAHFIEQIRKVEAVQECHSITGEYSYLLKVRASNTRELEQLMSEKITNITGVARTSTIMALTTFKETTQLNLN